MMAMTKEVQSITVDLLDKLQTNGAGYDIIRYISLPELFGEESDTLLYYMGRSLARKMDLHTLEDVTFAFEKLGWGRLELVKEKRRNLTFHLKSDAVVLRLQAPIETEFRLEAGFLAEAIQLLRGVTCECTEDIHKKIHQIQFKVIYTE